MQRPRSTNLEMNFLFQLEETSSSSSSSSSMAAMVKKPRLSSEGSSAPGVLLPPPPPGALPLPPPPPTHTTPEQYGVYLYNMAVATKNPAMAAWAANFANAIKVSPLQRALYSADQKLAHKHVVRMFVLELLLNSNVTNKPNQGSHTECTYSNSRRARHL